MAPEFVNAFRRVIELSNRIGLVQKIQAVYAPGPVLLEIRDYISYADFLHFYEISTSGYQVYLWRSASSIYVTKSISSVDSSKEMPKMVKDNHDGTGFMFLTLHIFAEEKLMPCLSRKEGRSPS